LILEKKHEWLETRCKPDQKFVGLATSDRFVLIQMLSNSELNYLFSGIYSCTSNGALRLTNIVDGLLSHETSTLPMRLCNWRLSSNSQTFAYGGDEVELSIWDTEKAFAADDNSTSQKRKRGAELLPAEIWRAKNVC
jgi:ribosome biogenesis protein NSA1